MKRHKTEYEKKKSRINYKITTFLEPIREPRAARHPMSPNAQFDKTHPGETEHTNPCTFDRTPEREVAAMKAGMKYKQLTFLKIFIFD